MEPNIYDITIRQFYRIYCFTIVSRFFKNISHNIKFNTSSQILNKKIFAYFLCICFWNWKILKFFFLDETHSNNDYNYDVTNANLFSHDVTSPQPRQHDAVVSDQWCHHFVTKPHDGPSKTRSKFYIFFDISNCIQKLCISSKKIFSINTF